MVKEIIRILKVIEIPDSNCIEVTANFLVANGPPEKWVMDTYSYPLYFTKAEIIANLKDQRREVRRRNLPKPPKEGLEGTVITEEDEFA